MAIWPATLPQDLRLPTQHGQQNATLRTQMDAGPDKVRRRFTAVTQPFTTSMLMDGAQYQALWDFYNDTLEGGTLRFEWESPLDDELVEIRFVEPPQGQIRSGGGPNQRTWFVNLNLEIMP